MSEIRRAFSVHAPWAWAFFHAGKDVENRSGNFPKYLGRVWVHASLWPGGKLFPKSRSPRMRTWDREMSAAYEIHRQMMNQMEPWRLRGHIVGSVEIYGRTTPDAPPASPWYVEGSHGILVRDPKPLARPVPAKGALGLWTVKPETLEELMRAA